MPNGKKNLEKYEEWVKDNYSPRFLEKSEVTAFVSPEEKGLSLNFMERMMLYMGLGSNVCLNGGTGVGKTTLLQNVGVLMDLPYYKENAYPKLTFEKATTHPTLRGDTAEIHPGMLSLAMLFNGIYHLEEAANIEPDNIVQLHETFDKGSVNIPTHFGNVEIYLRKMENFRIVLSGNFDYQKPAFNSATTQRFVWMDLPKLEDSKMKRLLMDIDSRTHTMKDNELVLDGIINKISSIYADQEKSPRSQDALTDMLVKLRSGISQVKEVPTDYNLALFKRAMACYSPKLGLEDYRKMVEEVVLYPVAARLVYSGRRDILSSLNSVAYETLKSYRSLFNDNVEAARGISFADKAGFLKKR